MLLSLFDPSEYKIAWSVVLQYLLYRSLKSSNPVRFTAPKFYRSTAMAPKKVEIKNFLLFVETASLEHHTHTSLDVLVRCGPFICICLLIRVFHENMFLKKQNGAIRSASIWGLV